jgi:hypothetical protein
MYVIVLLLLALLLLVSSSERFAADTTAATAATATAAAVTHSKCALCCNHRSEGIAGSGKWLVLVVMTSSMMPYSKASFGVMKKSRSVSSSICHSMHTRSSQRH